jgi:hypothetical protein
LFSEPNCLQSVVDRVGKNILNRLGFRKQKIDCLNCLGFTPKIKVGSTPDGDECFMLNCLERYVNEFDELGIVEFENQNFDHFKENSTQLCVIFSLTREGDETSVLNCLSSEQTGKFKKESAKAEIEIQNSDMQKMGKKKVCFNNCSAREGDDYSEGSCSLNENTRSKKIEWK